jgi:hypothetical protein
MVAVSVTRSPPTFDPRVAEILASETAFETKTFPWTCRLAVGLATFIPITALMVTTFMFALALVKKALEKGVEIEPIEEPPFTDDWIFPTKYD